jgi:hypothetical protein
MISLSQLILCVNNVTLRTDILRCPLTLGTEYRVQGLKRCHCGAIFVDVGITLDRARYDVVCRCGRLYDDGTWWFDVKRFRPAEADTLLWEKEELALSAN